MKVSAFFVALVLTGIFPASAFAQTPLAEWWTGDSATGDLFGIREPLGDLGITIQGNWRGNVLAVVDGGVERGAGFDEEVNLSIGIDAAKLTRWSALRGLTFRGDARFRDGKGVTQASGADSTFRPSAFSGGQASGSRNSISPTRRRSFSRSRIFSSYLEDGRFRRNSSSSSRTPNFSSINRSGPRKASTSTPSRGVDRSRPGAATSNSSRPTGPTFAADSTSPTRLGPTRTTTRFRSKASHGTTASTVSISSTRSASPPPSVRIDCPGDTPRA